MQILGLGGTVATPRAGITADVVVVDDFAHLESMGSRVKGKIVLFNYPMRYDPETGPGYGDAVEYRGDGPVRAAKQGAAAALVRSVTTRSLYTPHTGATRYEDGVKKIPAAAVTIEDAMLIARLAKAGERVRVKLVLSGKYLPDAKSGNVVGELRGRDKPEEIVVIGGHIDSWDVGQGAHDDGGGCVAMMQALTVLRKLGLVPRRTIRVVLFTNEENGLRGAIDYATQHAAELPNHVAAIESDSGTFAPVGFSVQASDAAVAQVTDIGALLAPLGATKFKAGFGGADLIPLARAGVPALGVDVDEKHYFDYHHTHADTLDKVLPGDLANNVAMIAVMAYVLADMPDRLVPGTQPQGER
jgi:carboxypeptidase Q